MTRAEVRSFIENGVNDLSAKVGFNSGRITEFNSQTNTQYPFCWLESLKMSSELNQNNLVIDTWEIVIHIAKKDIQGSSPAEYEAIVDGCDGIAQQLFQKYNQVISGYKLIQLSGMKRDPFIHKHADDTTGVILSFNITAADTTNLC